MRSFLRPFLIVPIFAIGLAGCADGEVDDPPPGSVTADEIADLEFMREEEKLARDVYLVLFDEWGLQVHGNIASSEQTHTDAVADMIEALGLEDPVVDDTVGVFVDTDLQALYADMVAAGMLSSVDALHVGATIEEVDMIDIQHAVDRADNPDIISLYEWLLCGSRNHLRAFVSQLDNAGQTYAAQYLSQAEVDAITSTPPETCTSP